ncbi:MAG: PGPGW domain-containing protein [candidate division Zixibacteria bacterium]|nr:PGPGW domain-containing protein [candidate division Zixibacteria bacterium]
MRTLRQLKRLIVAVVGFTVLAIGLAMIVLPGPAIVVVPTGLAILAAEFAWARKLLQRMKEKLKLAPSGNTTPTKTDSRQV